MRRLLEDEDGLNLEGSVPAVAQDIRRNYASRPDFVISGTDLPIPVLCETPDELTFSSAGQLHHAELDTKDILPTATPTRELNATPKSKHK